MKKNLEEEIENMEMELASKKAKLLQMQGVDQPQDGNTSTANPVTNEVDFEKMKELKKKMLLSKMG